MATLTAIKQQKRNPQRVNIYLDGVYAFPLAKIVAAWLKVGQELSPEKIAALQTEDEAEKAFQRSLNFLSYRPRSQAEIERNLRKHDIPEDLIAPVIERLKAAKLLDDADFARRWVENRGAFRPRGALALRLELRQKGVADARIAQALKGLDETKLARQAAMRKAGQLAELDWQAFRTKLSAFLARRGFGYEIVAEICRESWENLKEEQSSNFMKTEEEHG
ncbi:MAG: RecX family transcriptional regulator [Anaerolineales bacterium]